MKALLALAALLVACSGESFNGASNAPSLQGTNTDSGTAGTTDEGNDPGSAGAESSGNGGTESKPPASQPDGGDIIVGSGGTSGASGESGSAGSVPSEGGSTAEGGSSGEAGSSVGGETNEAGAAGATQVDPLEPYPAPDCDGFTAYMIPVDSCIFITGRFETRSPANCEIQNPTFDTCSTSTNIGQNDDMPIVRYIRAESGYSFTVTRHDLDGQVCEQRCESD